MRCATVPPMAEMSQAAEASSQANGADTKPVYELGFHIVPTIAEADLSSVVEKIRAELSKLDAEIIKDEFPTKRHLAYVIERAAAGRREKYGEAYFGSIKFAVEERQGISALEAWLRGAKEILRYLLIETVREDIAPPRRALFTSDRLQGETIHKPTAAPEKKGEVSEEELQKSIDALVN